MWEQLIYALFSWIPTVVGIGLRGVFYRLILRMDGWSAIENRVRLRYANYITLSNGVYLDQNTYLHACPQWNKDWRKLDRDAWGSFARV